mgnify:CR=1 FL=1
MAPKTFNVHEAKTRLSELLALVEAGEEVVIARAGKPVARLVKAEAKKPKIVFGLMKGKLHVPEDFDDPLPDDLLDLFEGKGEEPLAP